MRGFHEPKHIVELRKQQALEREKLLREKVSGGPAEEGLPEVKPKKKKERKKITELSDEDMSAFVPESILEEVKEED